MTEVCEACGEEITKDNPICDKDNLTCLDCYTGSIDQAWDSHKESPSRGKE